jgi:hypothetical protein
MNLRPHFHYMMTYFNECRPRGSCLDLGRRMAGTKSEPALCSGSGTPINTIFGGFLYECFTTQTVDDVTALGTEIFGSDSDPRVKKLKVSNSSNYRSTVVLVQLEATNLGP